MEESYEISFQLILHAGDAKSSAMEAILFSNEGDFDKAEESLKKAADELKEAHTIQTKLIQDEAGGNGAQLNILLVHAQDHLCMAMMTIDFAKQMLNMNKRIRELEEK
ncbi:MAG: PTS lactose/cellobiose transporter subunit IIA [Lachnospiraceae bacterium]|jgi:PTS system cellobiose-specific IIA component|nr:PTS lactose/cellobiose transporter subunit IIA [Lachnospiraceae bacterium]